MTEAEARAALAAFDGLGGLERWIAEQRPWQAAPGGWTVPGNVGSGAGAVLQKPCPGALMRCIELSVPLLPPPGTERGR